MPLNLPYDQSQTQQPYQMMPPASMSGANPYAAQAQNYATDVSQQNFQQAHNDQRRDQAAVWDQTKDQLKPTPAPEDPMDFLRKLFGQLGGGVDITGIGSVQNPNASGAIDSLMKFFGITDTNRSNTGIANIQGDTARDVSNIGLQGTKYGADQNTLQSRIAAQGSLDTMKEQQKAAQASQAFREVMAPQLLSMYQNQTGYDKGPGFQPSANGQGIDITKLMGGARGMPSLQGLMG